MPDPDAPPRSAHRPRPGVPRAIVLLLIGAWAAMLAWGAHAGEIPPWALGAALSLNVITVLTYAMDKNAAHAGQRRTPENHLHLLSLAGGWPGAWFAQQLLRHKSRKRPFLRVYWLTVAVHCLALTGCALGWVG